MNEPLTFRQQALPAEQLDEIVRAFVMRVFGWMAAGLLATAIVALFTVQSEPLMEFVFSTSYVLIALIILQIVLVGWLSLRVTRMSAMTATIVFMAYSALTGLTLSVIFLVYTAESLASTFFVAAGTFGLTAAYGYTTKRQLAGIGGYLTMGLIGLILASVVNIFLQSTALYWVTTYIGIGVFVGLTAWEMQKLKAMALAGMQDGEEEQKAAVMGALSLYLDFINLFLLLLRIFGRRK